MKNIDVEIYEIDLYFYRNYKGKIKVHKDEHAYVSFKTDAYFSEWNLTVEVDEK